MKTPKHPLLNEDQQHIKNLVDFCVSGERYVTANPYSIQVIRDAVRHLYRICKEEEYRIYPD